MGLLKPAFNQAAYLKVGLLGFEGSGKTHLACLMAIGMAEVAGIKRVAYYDSEKGSDFWVKRFKEAGIELDVLRSRSFSDLLAVIREAEGKYGFLIIDSISHVWRDLCEAYQTKHKKKSLSMRDWMILKTEWSQFTNLYVNSKLHIAMCGRAGYQYDHDEDEDGKKEIVKSGTKMKAEGETGFEPDLLIETYKVNYADILSDPKKRKAARGFTNRACVIKDRSGILNGLILDKPKFKDFMPILKELNIGGASSSIQSVNETKDIFDNPDLSWSERQKRQEIELERIKEILILADMDGTSAEAKKKRTTALIQAFGTSAWTAISNMRLEEIVRGVSNLSQLVIGDAGTPNSTGMIDVG